MEIFFWLAAFVVLTAIELATFQFVTIWFAAGALAAFAAAMLEAGSETQLITFLVVSVVLLVLIRPMAAKHIRKSRVRTNADSLIGQEAVITAEIHSPSTFGKAVIRGQEWTAAAEEGQEPISVGERVLIKDIQGVKLIVKKINK